MKTYLRNTGVFRPTPSAVILYTVTYKLCVIQHTVYLYKCYCAVIPIVYISASSSTQDFHKLMSLSIHRKSIYSPLSAPNTTDLKAEATDSKCILFVASVETILTHS